MIHARRVPEQSSQEKGHSTVIGCSATVAKRTLRALQWCAPRCPQEQLGSCSKQPILPSPAPEAKQKCKSLQEQKRSEKSNGRFVALLAASRSSNFSHRPAESSERQERAHICFPQCAVCIFLVRTPTHISYAPAMRHSGGSPPRPASARCPFDARGDPGTSSHSKPWQAPARACCRSNAEAPVLSGNGSRCSVGRCSRAVLCSSVVVVQDLMQESHRPGHKSSHFGAVRLSESQPGAYHFLHKSHNRKRSGSLQALCCAAFQPMFLGR